MIRILFLILAYLGMTVSPPALALNVNQSHASIDFELFLDSQESENSYASVDEQDGLSLKESLLESALYNGCCKICKKGKACGNSCIARSKNCTKTSGCACDG